jgi:hypothetical protein
MPSIINATTTNGVTVQGDNSGSLQLATNNGTTAVTISTAQNATFAQTANLPNTFGFKNRIINGDMRFDQRNSGASISTSTTGSQVYSSLDRYAYFVSQASKFTMQQDAGGVTPPAGFTDYLGCTSTAATSIGSGDYFQINQIIEGNNIADLNWGTANAKTITISFWVRSSLTGTFGGALRNSALNRSYPFTYTIASANTWEQKSVTVPGDTSGTWDTNINWGLQVIFSLGMGSTFSGTAGAWASANFASATGATSVVGTNGATFYITGVQLEVGTVATSFDYRSYSNELALCQRYFTIYRGGVYSGVQISSTTFSFPLSVPVPMRTSPTFATTMTDSRFVIASPSGNQWCMYVQNSGYNSYSGSIDTLSLNGPAANSTQYNIGTYGVTLNSFTGFLLGGNVFFSFSAEL